MSESKVLLLTDVVDSTKMYQQLGDSTMGALWAEHDLAARNLLRAHRGREIGRSDGFLVMFDDVDDALAFAHAYHQHLAHLPQRLSARVGAHLGSVVLRENSEADRALGATPFEVDGIALPTAARLMAAANGGQTLVSAEAASAVTDRRWQRRSHGHWRFKGLGHPIEVIEIGGEHTSFAPPPDLEKAYRVVQVQVQGQWCAARDLPHRLPAERDGFVGREPTLHQVSELIDAGARLVTLLGTGGIGKTRLALRFARSRLGDFAGGAWFCDLSAATTLDGVLRSVAQGLDLPLDTRDPVQQVGEAIAGRGRCLVVLDNFEQVASQAEATLGAWMSLAPLAVFVATSREVLGIGGESVLAVDTLTADEATHLFRQRALAAGVRSQELDGNLVDELVALLDRLPLAIEIAAVRLRAMPIAELRRGMGERFRLLVRRGGSRDRQATLRAAIDWSWALLSPLERAALAQLSVFEGGCTLDAALAVVDLSAVSPDALLFDALQGLVDKSMLRRGSNDRYELLRTVKDYAAEQLAVMAEVEPTRARHWRYFAALDQDEVSERRCDDLDNIVTACRHAAAGRDGPCAVRTLLTSARVVFVEGPVTLLDDLVARVRGVPALTPGQQAELAWVAGRAHYQLGRGAAALDAYRSGLAAARVSGQPALVVRLACAQVEPLFRMRDTTAVADLLAESDRLCRECPQPTLTCQLHISSGLVAHGEGRLVEARRHLEAALVIARAQGHRRKEAKVLGNLGTVLYASGDREQALAHYEQALAINLETGARRQATMMRHNIGWSLFETGEYAAATDVFQATVLAAREIGFAQLELQALANLAEVHRHLAQPDMAVGPLRAAAELSERLQDQATALEVWKKLATAFEQLGDGEAKRLALTRALAMAEQQGDSAARDRLRTELEAAGARS